VNTLDHRLRKINAQIDDEESTLHVLKAEWVYLSNPGRIEAETARHLKLLPTAAKRVADLRNLSLLLPGEGNDAAASVRLAQANGATLTPIEKPIVRVAQTKPKERPKTERDRVLATLNAGRINDHVNMQHTSASASASVISRQDRIGGLIS
jgi:hypothetical protein